jgi:hypothetical protein
VHQGITLKREKKFFEPPSNGKKNASINGEYDEGIDDVNITPNNAASTKPSDSTNRRNRRRQHNPKENHRTVRTEGIDDASITPNKTIGELEPKERTTPP